MSSTSDPPLGHRAVSQMVRDKAAKNITDVVTMFIVDELVWLYGSDAELVGQILQDAAVKSIPLPLAEPPSSIASVRVKKAHSYGRIVRDVLMRLQLCLEVWTVDERGVWIEELRGSPGNMDEFEDELESYRSSAASNASEIVMSVRVVKNMESTPTTTLIAVATVNLSEYTMTMQEFSDSSHLPNLESTIVRLMPRECHVCTGNLTAERGLIKAMLKRNNIPFFSVGRCDFAAVDVLADLDRLVYRRLIDASSEQRISCTVEPFAKLTAALQAMHIAIRHCRLLAHVANEGRFVVQQQEHDLFMRLDTTAVQRLELYDTEADLSTKSSRMASLYGLLNRCKTSAGERLMHEWIRQPLVDKGKIECRQRCIGALIASSSVRRTLMDELLPRVPDLWRALQRLCRDKAQLIDCYRLYTVAEIIHRFAGVVGDLESEDESTMYAVKTTFVNPLSDCTQMFVRYSQGMRQMLDEEFMESTGGECRVKPIVCKKLVDLAAQMDDAIRKADALLAKATRALEVEEKAIKLQISSTTGFALRITKREESVLRSHSQFTIIDSRAGAVRFTSDALAKMSDGYVELCAKYEEAQATIVRSVISMAVSYIQPIRRMCAVLAQLDVICALADVAATSKHDFVCPKILDWSSTEGTLELLDCRHPMVEADDSIVYTPNDVLMHRDGDRMLLVSGPNMGGKSTYIRSVALTTLLAHMGAYVPCRSATVPLFDAIHVRCGASDSMQDASSTFMNEMREAAVILDAATQYSLVIIDELGRGTSTYDGFGLAAAIAESLLCTQRPLCLFATHFHELCTMLVLRYPYTVRNVNMQACVGEENICLLYKVVDGASPLSFGVNIAKQLKFPQSVIDAATTQLRELETEGGRVKEENARGEDEGSIETLKAIQHDVHRIKQLAAAGDEAGAMAALAQFLAKHDVGDEEMLTEEQEVTYTVDHHKMEE